MESFNVEVEVAAASLDGETVERLCGLLDHRGNARAISVELDEQGGVEARFVVSGVSGVPDAVAAVGALLGTVLPAGWTLERTEVMTLQKMSGVFSKPRYVGATEIAKLLGVSRQRVDQLRRGDPNFPPPDAELAAGPIWTMSTLRSFLGSWERRVGRPKRDAPSAIQRRGDLYLVPTWVVVTAPEFGWIKEGVDAGHYSSTSMHRDGRDAFVPVPAADFERHLDGVMDQMAQNLITQPARNSLDSRLRGS